MIQAEQEQRICHALWPDLTTQNRCRSVPPDRTAHAHTIGSKGPSPLAGGARFGAKCMLAKRRQELTSAGLGPTPIPESNVLEADQLAMST